MPRRLIYAFGLVYIACGIALVGIVVMPHSEVLTTTQTRLSNAQATVHTIAHELRR